MRSQRVLATFLVVLVLQLILVPFAGVVGLQPPLAQGPDASVAAKEKQTKPASQRAAKNKKAKKQKQKQRARKAKRNNAKKRNGRAARQNGDTGQRREPIRLKGGLLKSGQREVARMQAQSEDPGERYIVLFANERVDSRALTANLDAATPGVIPFAIYQHAVKGFAAYLTPEARQELARDPRVASITPDRKRQLAVQTIPRGISRIGVTSHPLAKIDGQDQRVNVDIAIIDTGVDMAHPDLNTFAYLDCTATPQLMARDINGHGTHVAGTAAALDNNIGVVGVAPGARIWNFRVEDNNGDMMDSYIIACMDAVALNASVPVGGQTIDVANMSLGGFFPEDRCGVGDPFNDAVCGMVAAGVTTVVAAGNESSDAAFFNPANIDQVITVSALADSDGAPGRLGGAYSDFCTNSQADDSLATFSNYGADVDIAAPGVGVLSTWPTYLPHSCVPASGTGYEVLPGTSMASPHVAGAAGLLLAQNPNLTPAQVRAALRANREQVALLGDPDGINEGVLRAASQDGKGPSVTVKGPGQGKVGQSVTLKVTANDPIGVARVVLYRCKPKCTVVAQDARAPYQFVQKLKATGTVKYKVRAYDNVGNFTEKNKSITVKQPKGKKGKKRR